MNEINIMIVGVGGQGTLLASRIIGNVAINSDYDVKLSEIHGMAQRGGSVITSVKLADKVYSPIIEEGEADIILAFEELEALRWLDYLSAEGRMIINKQQILPSSVQTGQALYPEGIVEKIREINENTISVDALSMARECGTSRAVNTVLIGIMASFLDFPKKMWLAALEKLVPARYLAANLKAFEKGYNYRLQ
ncbi:MAG TPA: indolepyruvate oxidoreductase subunit beta [Halanaerobiaceae bacterium]|jgi:indolepyruvate ferredoxin oxidoreductase beta subunit|nr:indolepyruvate oxidoreductase subunit beta [Bacillota bacterium]HHU92924.1 indolepyruvate oxidoreductase subunit beta [Halanaerobiaceae bacterium]HOA41104.1 indolepyruvate oxidoreductase subunit beta [Halanaerobiales bacterium]HPZ63393.1 indolepyruvate oxidoreductase subunit beta [Halanaerobiales bacterium]HQD03933.1 indolepyruvate oxidoreductase subunit beta [Halanaerobiales bacterium]